MVTQSQPSSVHLHRDFPLRHLHGPNVYRVRCVIGVLKRLQIRFIADPALAFTKGLDLAFDGAAIFGGDRGKRYALVIENGKVKKALVEPDNIGLNGEHYNRYEFVES